MTKQYKLIQTYPGSPAINSIADWFYSTSNYEIRDGDCVFRYDADVIENNPQFWVKYPLQYKIISFQRSKGKGMLKVLQEDGYYHWCYTSGKDSAEDLLKRDFIIYSVERLSDGVIFTIGDDIDHNPSSRFSTSEFKTRTIRGFNIDEKHSGMLASIDDEFDSRYCGNKGINISSIKLTDTKLFTTEDDVDIYCGDVYWCVNTAPHLWSLFKQTAKERTMLNLGVKAFSTEHRAKEYRFTNIPCLSINDIGEVYSSATDRSKTRLSGWCKYAESLRDVAKRKQQK